MRPFPKELSLILAANAAFAIIFLSEFLYTSITCESKWVWFCSRGPLFNYIRENAGLLVDESKRISGPFTYEWGGKLPFKIIPQAFSLPLLIWVFWPSSRWARWACDFFWAGWTTFAVAYLAFYADYLTPAGEYALHLAGIFGRYDDGVYNVKYVLFSIAVFVLLLIVLFGPLTLYIIRRRQKKKAGIAQDPST